MPARRPGRYPDVRAAKPTGPTRREDQCPTIARQTGLLLGGRRVERGPRVHGGGPGVVNAAAGGGPQIGPAQAPGAGREAKDLPALGAQRRGLVGGRRVAELRNPYRRPASLPVPPERRILKVWSPAPPRPL